MSGKEVETYWNGPDEDILAGFMMENEEEKGGM